MASLKQLKDRICKALPVKAERWYDGIECRLDIEYRGRYVCRVTRYYTQFRVYSSNSYYGCIMTASDVVCHVRHKMHEIDLQLP